MLSTSILNNLQTISNTEVANMVEKWDEVQKKSSNFNIFRPIFSNQFLKIQNDNNKLICFCKIYELKSNSIHFISE